MADSEKALAGDEVTELTREDTPAPGNDDVAPEKLSGITLRDILRTHELIRRFGWSHLVDRRPS